MPPSPVYNAFERTSCIQLVVGVAMPLPRPTVSRIRGHLSGIRRNLPFYFAAAYPGEGKDRIGAIAALTRADRSTFGLGISWSGVSTDPPAGFGQLSDLIQSLTEPFGEREISVGATFSYDKEMVISLFKPIQLAQQQQPTLFDELVGFTGIKRDPRGKTLYELEVSHGTKRLTHVVRFTQNVKLSEDLPLILLETAHKISALALKPKEG